MSLKRILEFAVIIGALLMGAGAGGVGLGLWGAVCLQNPQEARILLILGLAQTSEPSKLQRYFMEY